MIYSGKEFEFGPHRNLGNDIVMKLGLVCLELIETYMLTGIFSSRGLVFDLLQQNLIRDNYGKLARSAIAVQSSKRKSGSKNKGILYDHSNKIL